MKRLLFIPLVLFVLTVVSADPPYEGTIFIDADIITTTDPSTFVDAIYAGQGMRTMFDRRVNDWITVNAFLFNTTFDDGLSCEIQVNPEFGSSDSALIEAETYGLEIGRLPTCLRNDVETVWIHLGIEPFGGGNNNILIHTGQAEFYIEDGILEETLVHEASHTSLDAYHASSSGWLDAQSLDGEFISNYAQDNPNTEDIAESFLVYLAIQYRSDRISEETYQTITETIPNRIQYFNEQNFNMFPIDSSLSLSPDLIPLIFALHQNYPNPFNPITSLRYDLPEQTQVILTIYDLMGREVTQLVNTTQEAGYKSVQWNATDMRGKPVSAGVYLYQIRSGEFVQTRKMVLLK